MVIKSHSWTVYNDNSAVKQTDKSVFKNHGSGIPVKIRGYFSIDEMEIGDNVPIKVHFDGKEFKAKLERIRSTAGQTRVMWNSDLSECFNEKYPRVLENQNYPILWFNKINDREYKLDFEKREYEDVIFVNPEKDLESVVPLSGNKEGRKVAYYTTKYERNPENRKRAIDKWGAHCLACGFDFEKTYGERGRGFIEVHHIKPLYNLNEEVEVVPETDMICLCSNCHRMVHRKRDSILSLEELKALIKSNKK